MCVIICAHLGWLGALAPDVMTSQIIKLNRAEFFVDANSRYLLSPSDSVLGPPPLASFWLVHALQL